MYKTNRFNCLATLLDVQLAVNILACSLILTTGAPAAATPNAAFHGDAAFADLKHAVSFGERPSGSAENARLRAWIQAQLKPLGGELSVDSFTAQTPTGAVNMANVILRFPGTSGQVIAVTGHYDTKKIPMVHFVGANDAGSSTGFLLEFARAIAKTRHASDVQIVFFDGEEAVGNWSETDSCYGSRHLVAKWADDGTLRRLKALINVDMVGDKELDLLDDQNSSPALRRMARQAAARLGFAKYLHSDSSGIDDDHKPFADSGANVLDLIDFNFGPGNSYWHSARDTTDKLSAHSLQVVGDIVLAMFAELDAQR
jgi:glutaminyl-peptide cyclotransferase